MLRFVVSLLVVLWSECLLAQDLPIVVVTEDDTIINQSCLIRIPPGLVIEDRAGDGVIRILGEDHDIAFETGSVLRGAPAGTPPDHFQGVGIWIEGTEFGGLEGATIEGYRIGVRVQKASGLMLRRLVFPDGFRQRLWSSARMEDPADWLTPHRNDDGEWERRYGASISVHDARALLIEGCRGRAGQNGILLDRVTDSVIRDCDFSFHSGWGLAMWRSSRNTVLKNAFDFCVRGYSHGVYNRGQDSAGILMFEQCHRNRILENSATHCGDGFFGHAGREALGETPGPEDFDYRRCGNNDNLIQANDFSHAVAHGIEMTFSFGNEFSANRLEDCGICGIWGGYARDSLIIDNQFVGNGKMGYGLERGGVDIEHGQRNIIIRNQFREDRCGVHLWWDDDAALSQLPWARANGHEVADQWILANRFEGGDVGIQLRDLGATVHLAENHLRPGTLIVQEGRQEVLAASALSEWPARARAAYDSDAVRLGPIGTRRGLGGREAIVMTEWGPWDHASDLARCIGNSREGVIIELRADPASPRYLRSDPGTRWNYLGGDRWELSADRPGLFAWAARTADGATISGVLWRADWSLRLFSSKVDPQLQRDDWRRDGQQAPVIETPQLCLRFGSQGPAHRLDGPELSQLGEDAFGILAETTVTLPAGRYRLRIRSDDGVAAFIDGKPVIDRWTIHVPTNDEARFDSDGESPLQLQIEYFEHDGYATLEVELEAIHD
ncbi:MAG: right-handed parallel beta-helix repeat-containing protein [Planctomycetes bacterium]|nr:right-handed parallel beta-helix repeat-containing protein [Planctomycetota bacterium]